MFWAPSDQYLKIHKETRKNHSNKNSLNLTKGEAGGLSDNMSNLKRGQASGLCNFCGYIYTDSEDLKMHIKSNHSVHGGGEKRPSALSDSSDSSDDDSITDCNTSNMLYKENEWGNEELISQPPIGRNFKSKNEMFAVAATKLKKLYRKNSIKIVGENTIHVMEVERKGTAIEATVQIEDKDEKGKVLLTFWGPNKKTKETTIQVNTTKGSDKRFVNLFSDKFIKPLIDKVSNGIGIANFFKKKGNFKRVCNICDANFVFKIDLKDHKVKKHNDSLCKILVAEKQKKTNNTSIICDTCDFVADSTSTLGEHIDNVHNTDFWLVGSKGRKKDNEIESSDKMDVTDNEDETSLSDRRDKQILEKREHEEQEEEERNKKAEEKRLQGLIIKDNRNRAKNLNKRKERTEEHVSKKKDTNILETESKTDIDMNIKDLPPSVKCLHPESVEFCVPGNRACCLNCLAAFIYLDPNEGPILGRDLNTHIATYRSEYLKRLIFPRSVTVGSQL